MTEIFKRHLFNVSSFFFLSANMEEEEFMIYTAASLQGGDQDALVSVLVAVMSSIFIHLSFNMI